MQEEMTYKRLRDLAREEKAQPGLVALPADFYAEISAFLSSKFSEMEASRSVLVMREFENAVAVIREISAIRRQKILFKAIRSSDSHDGTGAMTRDEHELFDRFCALLSDSRAGLDGVLLPYESKRRTRQAPAAAPAAVPAASSAPSQKGHSGEQDGSSLKKVRFLKEVPAYRGPNNETYGPYKIGEEGNLPTGEAEWLLKGKLAESLE